jgi:hypothetical protein
MVDPEADPDIVEPLLQTVVVTTCPEDNGYEVELVNGGWLFVSVLVIVPLELTAGDSVVAETAELLEVVTPPVGVTVITTTVPEGLEAAVELAEPEPEMVEVMVLTPVCSEAVVFQGSWDPVVDTRLEGTEVVLTAPELQGLAVETDGAVNVSVWTIVVELSVHAEVVAVK